MTTLSQLDAASTAGRQVLSFPPVYQAPTDTGRDRDTSGAPVPVYKAHVYTYDASNLLVSDTVSDGVSTWVRTYGYSGGGQTSDSGWVRQ